MTNCPLASFQFSCTIRSLYLTTERNSHMSEIKLNLLDARSSIHATVHGSVGDALVAALSAEPETVEELEIALRRFQKCETIPASSLNRRKGRQIDEESYDAGILIIDLATRIVVCESTYSMPGSRGIVNYHDGSRGTSIPISYHLADDWMFSYSLAEYLHYFESDSRNWQLERE